MQIQNNFIIDLPVPEAWRTLLDIPAAASCIPGATLLEMAHEKTFRGEVRAKLGLIAMTFRGTAEFERVDKADRLVLTKEQ